MYGECGFVCVGSVDLSVCGVWICVYGECEFVCGGSVNLCVG